MSAESEDEFIDHLNEKAAEAQSEMWNMEANIFGLVIAAASVLVTVSQINRWLLAIPMALSFAGVLLVLWCYATRRAMFVLGICHACRDEQQKKEQWQNHQIAVSAAAERINVLSKSVGWLLVADLVSIAAVSLFRP